MFAKYTEKDSCHSMSRLSEGLTIKVLGIQVVSEKYIFSSCPSSQFIFHVLNSALVSNSIFSDSERV